MKEVLITGKNLRKVDGKGLLSDWPGFHSLNLLTLEVRQNQQVLSRSPSSERLVEYFRELGITHIALRRDLFDQFTEANLLSVEKKAWGEFRTLHLRLLYEGKGYQLYQVRGGLDASDV